MFTIYVALSKSACKVFESITLLVLWIQVNKFLNFIKIIKCYPTIFIFKLIYSIHFFELVFRWILNAIKWSDMIQTVFYLIHAFTNRYICFYISILNLSIFLKSNIYWIFTFFQKKYFFFLKISYLSKLSLTIINF